MACASCGPAKCCTLSRMTDPTQTAPRYQHVAWAYDLLASAYSLGAIDRAKRWHHHLVEPGNRVLYAGAGRGREIVGTCQLGAELTCIEPCPAMATRLHTRLSMVADGFTVVPTPIQAVPAEPVYDLVIAHFFLNVFDAADMPRVLQHLTGFVKPGGRLVIADFKPATDMAGPIDRVIRSLYYLPVNLAGWLLRICALHPIYDYRPGLAECGLIVESQHPFQILPGLPAMYEVITARRV